MRDFVLVGKESSQFWTLANILHPRWIIIETEPYSKRFWFKKLLSLDPLSIIANAWLHWKLKISFFDRKLNYDPDSVDRIPRLDENYYPSIDGKRVCLFGSSIVPRKVISFAKEIVNLHLGYLPDYKGCKPEIWALAQGGVLGVTVHQVMPKIDAGKILYRYFLPEQYHWFNGWVVLRFTLLFRGSKLVEDWYNEDKEVSAYYQLPDKCQVIKDGKEAYYSTPSWRVIWKAFRNMRSL